MFKLKNLLELQETNNLALETTRAELDETSQHDFLMEAYYNAKEAYSLLQENKMFYEKCINDSLTDEKGVFFNGNCINVTYDESWLAQEVTKLEELGRRRNLELLHQWYEDFNEHCREYHDELKAGLIDVIWKDDYYISLISLKYNEILEEVKESE